jgi:hypothetical protein
MNFRTAKFFRTTTLCERMMLCLLVLWAVVDSALAIQGESKRANVLRLGNRTLNFESNQGQYDDPASFVSRGPNYYLALSATEVRVTLRKVISSTAEEKGLLQDVKTPGMVNYRSLLIELLGANKQAQMSGAGEIAGRANYFIGDDPGKWRTGVPTYDRVRVADVYPGINLLHYGNQHHLEYDFEIAPGANPGAIAMRFIGADKIVINSDGDLVLTLGGEEIRQPKPVIYQIVRGQRKEITGSYLLADSRTVQFSLGDYDHRQPLVIDPVVSYVYSIEGFDGADDDYVRAVAVGADGDVYLAGETMTAGLASTNAFQTNLAGVLAQHGDVFVMRNNNDTSARVYFTYLGGIAYEAAFGLAVDADGNAYVTGYTGSTNFPTRQAIQPSIAGTAPPGFVPALDCFITKIGPYGSNLIFSTYYGGSGSGYFGDGDEVGYGIALDSGRNIYVAGYTAATNFPCVNTTSTNANGLDDGFLVKLDASGTNVAYAMYLGGASRDYAKDVAVDAADNPVVVGYTSSTNFPVTPNALQALLNNTTNFSLADDGFLSKVQSESGTLTYSTYLGGTNQDQAVRLATDASGAAYVTGWTLSGDFPHTGTNFAAPILTNQSAADVFVVKLNSNNTNLDYAVLFGGLAKDQAWDIAVDAAGQAHVVGATESLDFPTNAVMEKMNGTNSGGSDAFIAKIDTDGTAFIYSGYWGTSAADLFSGVTLDEGGNSYSVGTIKSGAFPAQIIIFKILTDTALAIAADGTNVNVSWPGYAAELHLQGSTNLLGSNIWQTLPNPSIFTNSRHVVTLPATNAANFFRLTK